MSKNVLEEKIRRDIFIFLRHIYSCFEVKFSFEQFSKVHDYYKCDDINHHKFYKCRHLRPTNSAPAASFTQTFYSMNFYSSFLGMTLLLTKYSNISIYFVLFNPTQNWWFLSSNLFKVIPEEIGLIMEFASVQLLVSLMYRNIFHQWEVAEEC